MSIFNKGFKWFFAEEEKKKEEIENFELNQIDKF